MFHDLYRGRRVLVTGHTGFKGSWLSLWLSELGANLAGLALPPSTQPNLFSEIDLSRLMASYECDIRHAAKVSQIVTELQPEVIFHLAAQPLVLQSYRDPRETWETNVIGTLNVLEAARRCTSLKAFVIVTSDKCYENSEQLWGYREIDPVGGHDPYSASKGATEILASSYRSSFFSDPAVCRIATARAGNVLGGGDWSSDRIATDLVRSIANGDTLKLRNPQATRPWQHVLDPLAGYLCLGSHLLGDSGAEYSEAWNFGPDEASTVPVANLAQRMIAAWGTGNIVNDEDSAKHEEANLLKLDSSKARARLGWRPVWELQRCVNETVNWYRAHRNEEDLLQLSRQQIKLYREDAAFQGVSWSH